MIEAYVFITTRGDTQRIASEITKYEAAVNVHILEPSDYDLVVYARALDLIRLRAFCTGALGSIAGIRRATTLICAYEEPIGSMA
jgi:hypothetical protein